MTNSRALRGCPCQTRSYRSRMRPALAAKSGSRGKIQLRCRQGRSASTLSQRHKVAPLISATNPWVITSRRISERESRDSGSCKRCGSSQARALTWTTTLGGKVGGSAAPRLRLEAGKPREGKSLAPLADDLARSVQVSSDDVVGEPFRRKQHDLGSDHITIRRRVLAHLSLQQSALFFGENYREWAF